MKKICVLIICLIVLALIAVGGCGTSSDSPTPTGGPTFGSLSQLGQPVFMSKCAMCHGASGQGGTAPAVIGTGANLSKYSTGKALLDYISTAMPLNAPGSLSHQDYLNVLSYLLVQNKYATATAAFDENALGNLQLK